MCKNSHLSVCVMQENILCDRCRKLEEVIQEFEKPVPLVDNKPDRIDRSHQEIISSRSFQETCRICRQLTSLFKACVQGVRETRADAETPEILLKCRYWWHPDLVRLVAYHRVSYRGKLSFVFLRLDGTLPLSIVDRNQADFHQLRTWYHNCKTQHEFCNLHVRTLPVPKIAIRAINCTTRKICTLPPQTDYICLSYVWGSMKDAPFRVGAGAGKTVRRLPKTIDDAVHVTLQLGINYLWVDRYCIDQHDPEEKHHMINNMDQIYLNATFTIIAAEGHGPHAGLPGVCNTPRKPQRIIKPGGLTLLGIESISRYVQNSKWNTRGWTYQEMLLSRRILLFTDTRVYYQCLSGFGLEGVTKIILPRRPERTSNNWSWTEKVPGTRPVFPIFQGKLDASTILNRLSDYFDRSLSFPADTVRAVQGIFNALKTSHAFQLNHLFGMPIILHKKLHKTAVEDFVERLTWVVGVSQPGRNTGISLGDEYGLPNTDLSTFTPGAAFSQRTDLFPSWSWASFKADCPESERVKGIKLVFPRSHKQVDTRRTFDASDTNVRICRRNGTTARLSNFVSLHHDSDDYEPWVDVTAWTWKDLFSLEMLGKRVRANHVSLHLDDSCSAAENRLTAIHAMAYKTNRRHEEELHSMRDDGEREYGQKLTRVSSNPRERSYHIRMLMLKRNGFQTYVRVGIMTIDTMWYGQKPPDTVEDLLNGMMIANDNIRGCWKRKTLRLV